MAATTLDTLLPGQTGRILEINCAPSMRLRLLHMGFVKNTLITCEGSSPHGSPKAYSLRGCMIALRTDDCQKILIEEVSHAQNHSSCRQSQCRKKHPF